MSTMTPSSTAPAVTDRIEKQVLLRAPRSRVWRALADSEDFGRWFGCRFEGGFAPGAAVRGTITDPPGYESYPWEVWIERMEPERLLSFRWHPGELLSESETAGEPTTLVTFTLEEVPEGTRLTLVESGFDALPPHRRAPAFKDNDGGWSEQMVRIARHVEAA